MDRFPSPRQSSSPGGAEGRGKKREDEVWKVGRADLGEHSHRIRPSPQYRPQTDRETLFGSGKKVGSSSQRPNDSQGNGTNRFTSSRFAFGMGPGPGECPVQIYG